MIWFRNRCRFKPHRQCRRLDLSPRGIFAMPPPKKCTGQVKNKPCDSEAVIAPLYLCEACSVESYWKRINGISRAVKKQRRVAGCEDFNAGCNGPKNNCWETEGGTNNPIEVPQALSRKLKAKCTVPGVNAMFDDSHSGQVKFRFPHQGYANILIHMFFRENVVQKTFFIHRRPTS